MVKSFSNNRRDYDKVAPAHGPPRTTKRVICGTPEIGEISTSITEREMLALRTNLRRLVRRGSGHSKSLEHHTATVATFATAHASVTSTGRVIQIIRPTSKSAPATPPASLQIRPAAPPVDKHDLFASAPSRPPEPR